MRTILIVEDTDLCRDALELALIGVDGVKLRLVGTAEEALRELDGDHVCALVTDLHLASRGNSHGDFALDGFELIATVRAHAAHASLPIVVTTGDSHPDTAARLSRLGVDAFFAKPYSPMAVRSKLEQLIHISGTISQNVSGDGSNRGVHSASHHTSSNNSPPQPAPRRKVD